MKARERVKVLAIHSMRTPLQHPIEVVLDDDSRRALESYRWGNVTITVFQAVWGGFGLWMLFFKGDVAGALLCGAGGVWLFQHARPPFPHRLRRRIK